MKINIVVLVGVIAGFVASAVVEAQQAPLRVRESFASVRQSPTKLAALKRGIEVMKSRPATDPTSWQFQANIHGMLGQPTSQLHRQCQHGTPFFYVWHRGYLHYFEKILREASGDPELTLPYWDWIERPTLPLEFRMPAATSNPLFHPGRTMNDGSSINSQLIRIDLQRAMNRFDYFQFQRAIEGSPHGRIHVDVGGNMGSVPTAANDTIFWLHHANIDRMWDHWLSSSNQRTNPTNQQFLNTRFSFADENGNVVTHSVHEILSSSQLGYRYDDVPQPASPVNLEMNLTDETLIATSESQFEGADDLKLGFESKTLNLSFSDDGQSRFEAALSNTSEQSVSIKITGIQFSETPKFSYGVYLNLPEDETNSERALPHYVGSIDFFSAGHVHEADPESATEEKHKFDAVLDISETVVNLQTAGTWDPSNVSVTLLPLAPIPPKDKEEEKMQFYRDAAEKSAVEYEKIEIVTGG